MTAAPRVDPARIPGRDWDAVVVGAGLSGATAAYGLARRGFSVLLVDRAGFPRWKVCGCCLNPNARAELAAAGLGQLPERCGAVPLPVMTLAADRRRADIPLSGWVAVSRQRLDTAVIEAGIGAGVSFVPETTARLGPAVNGHRLVTLRHPAWTGEARARLVLAADGLGGRLAAGVDGPGIDTEVTDGSRVGAGVMLDGGPEFYASGKVWMAVGAGGYLGLVRVEDGRLNLAGAFDPGALKDGGPAGAATRILAAAGWPIPAGLAAGGWKGTVPLTRRSRRPAAERVFVLGDAAGYVEPFTGEGMAWAVGSGRAVLGLAARAAAAWDPQLARAWAARHRRHAAARQRFCRLIMWVTRRPRVSRGLVAGLGVFPGVGALVLDWLGAPRRGRPGGSTVGH